MPFRIGVIGVGYLGRHHARVFSTLDDTELAGVFDIDGARAGEIVAQYGCRSFASRAELIGACDAVSIVTPTVTHCEIAMECLAAGKDLFVEKPIAESLAEAAEIVGMAERRNLILQVGHLERFNPGVVAAEPFFADPRFIESERLSPFLGRGADVDVTLDLMIHDIDIVMSIVSSPLKDIKATGVSVLTGKIDVAKAWLEFENGCKALITASRLASEKVRKLRVHQRESYISIDYQKQEVRRYFKTADDVSFDIIRPEAREPLVEELRDFVRCLRTREKPKVSGREAVGALEVAVRISEILREGK